jgi:hypothetical protein
MKIQNLNIERRPTYDIDYPNMLVGPLQTWQGFASNSSMLATKEGGRRNES